MSAVSGFRQDSWQWDRLHDGRMTTSRVAGAMGLLEPRMAELMGVPRSLYGHNKAIHSHRHMRGSMRSKCITDAAQAEAELIEWDITEEEADNEREREESKMRRLRKLWRPWDKGARQREKWSQEYHGIYKSNGPRANSGNVRMMWGNIHEATAVLVALNYFHKNAMVMEAGMYAAETQLEAGEVSEGIYQEQLHLVRKLMKAGCPLGASPDALIVHRRGKKKLARKLEVEVLEVKNHSPFFYVKRKNRAVVRDRDPPEEVPPWYVPQLQLEMFCVGPQARSAVLVRLTATKGAVLMRIPRDDEYILAMLKRILYFQETYVLSDVEPPVNFGGRQTSEVGSDDASWKHPYFTDATVKVAKSAKIVAKIEHGDVQRARPSSSPLII